MGMVPAAAPADKSVGVAFALTFFLGPLGLFYVSIWGGVILFVVALLGVATFGVATALAWIISIIFGCVRASQQHSAFQIWLTTYGAGAGSRPMSAAASVGSGAVAGWYADPGGSGRLRWWDGFRWTDHYAGSPPDF